MIEWVIPPADTHPGFAVGDRVVHGQVGDYPEWEAIVLGRCSCCSHLTITAPAGMGTRTNHVVNGTPHKSWTTSIFDLTNLTRGPDAKFKMRIEGNELILEQA